MTAVSEAMFSLEPCAASTPATSPSGPVAVWQPASASAAAIMQAARPLLPVIPTALRFIAGFPCPLLAETPLPSPARRVRAAGKRIAKEKGGGDSHRPTFIGYRRK